MSLVSLAFVDTSLLTSVWWVLIRKASPPVGQAKNIYADHHTSAHLHSLLCLAGVLLEQHLPSAPSPPVPSRQNQLRSFQSGSTTSRNEPKRVNSNARTCKDMRLEAIAWPRIACLCSKERTIRSTPVTGLTRMSSFTPSRAACNASSRPMPLFAPVICHTWCSSFQAT